MTGFITAKIGRFISTMATATVALLGVLGSTTTSAQNYAGDGRLRFGTFLQLNASSGRENLPADSSADVSGFGLGASLGYDWNLYKNWIVGIEADGVATDAYNTDYFATFRGRVAYQYNPKLLLYGTSGIALNGVHFRGPPTTASSINGNSVFKMSTTLPGFVGGLGAEYQWNGMHLFGEYLYSSFEEWTFTGGSDGRHSYQTDAHMFRIGVKFLYGHDHMYENDRRPPPRRY
jgi:opacity protein-like surface antigen